MTNASLHPETRTPSATDLDPRRWVVLAILAGSLLLIAMDATILNVAFPSLVADLRPSSVQQLWIIDAYALALSGLLVTMGALGDRWGRKKLLVLGFAVFAAASLGAAFATAAWQVILMRALLGIGGAMIMPSTLSILRQVFTDARERALAYAIWAAVIGGGMALGPVVGGLLVEHNGWQSAFLLNIPVALAVIAFGLWLVPESRNPRAGSWDWWGVGQSVVGMLALAAGIKQLGKEGFTDPTAWLLLVVAVVALTVFVRRQLRIEYPLLQVRLFADRSFSIAAASIFLSMIAMGAVSFLLTQWFQYAQGLSPMEAGVRLLPAPVALIAASMIATPLMDRFAIRHVLGTSLLLMSAGLALPWVLDRAGDGLGYPAVAVSLALLGMGAGISTTVASVTLMAATPTRYVGGAAAIEETCYELGAAMGVAMLGSLASVLYRNSLSDVTGPSADTVRDSIGEAAHVADTIGGSAGADLLHKAADAFTSGMTPTFLLAAALPLAAAALAWARIPRDLRPTENAH